MQFSRIPEAGAPLGGPLVYAFAGERSHYDLRIVDAARKACCGAKRFADVDCASFDAAPILRRACTFAPATGPTGVYSADARWATAVVELVDRTSGQTLAAPERRFLPAAEAAAAPALLTALPANRLIAAGESDELTLLTDAPLELTLRIEYGPHVATETHRLPAAGLHLFRLCTADFPQADRITVDAGPCGTVVYSVTAPVQGAVRLAWRSRAGSVEHYTFPTEVAAGVEALRREAYGPDGYVGGASVESYRKLRSAAEGREVLEALAELLATPEVWLVEGDRYTPVNAAAERAVVHSHGALRWMEITVRPKTKPAEPWNC